MVFDDVTDSPADIIPLHRRGSFQGVLGECPLAITAPPRATSTLSADCQGCASMRRLVSPVMADPQSMGLCFRRRPTFRRAVDRESYLVGVLLSYPSHSLTYTG